MNRLLLSIAVALLFSQTFSGCQLSTSSPTNHGFYIRGTVIDDETQLPISGAQVIFGDTVVTGADGTFTFPTDSKHTQKLYIYKSGYQFGSSPHYMDIYESKDLGKLSMYPYVHLVAHFDLDGTGADSSGHGHNGVMHNVTPVADRFGNAGHAVQFTDATSDITIPDNPELNFDTQQDFTITAWVKVDGDMVYGSGPIVNKSYGTVWQGGGGSFTGYKLNIYGSGNGWLPMVELGSYNGTELSLASTESSGLYTSQTGWHLVTLVCGRSQSVQFFVDDKLVDNEQNIGLLYSLATTAPLMLGGNAQNSVAFKGSLDDVRIYNGKLTSGDILELYHQK